MKTCPKCSDEKDESEFYFKDAKRGLRQTNCKSCCKAYREAYYAENPGYYKEKAYKWTSSRRAELRVRVRGLRGQPCRDCRKPLPEWLMHFDHVNGKKVSDISIMVNKARPWDLIEKELKKCELVCSNCHANRTHCRRLGIPLVRYWEVDTGGAGGI